MLMETGKKRTDKRKQLAHKIFNKIHGVMNNINDIYCESRFCSLCYIEMKSQNFRNRSLSA